jgi:RNA polymerase sigma factor (sigma-70 family)
MHLQYTNQSVVEKPMINQEPTVFVVDDDMAVRDSLRTLLESVGKKVEVFSSAQDFLDHFKPEDSGCLVLDIRMPGISGMELQDRLNKEGNHIPIIFITGHGDIPIAVSAMRKGAFDFIQKPFSNNEFISRIDDALELNEKQHLQQINHQTIEQRFISLTEREREVLSFITEGKSNKFIAYELGVSQRTVEAHRAHIMEKMQTKSLAHLMRMVLSRGELNVS